MSLTAKLALSPVLVAQALRPRAKMPRLPEAAGARHGQGGRLAKGHQNQQAQAGPGSGHERENQRCGGEVGNHGQGQQTNSRIWAGQT